MIAFAAGVIVCAIVYTFFPTLAAKPSAWLRAAWARTHAPVEEAIKPTVPESREPDAQG